MPLLRLRHHIAVGELSHLVTDSRERLLQSAVSDHGIVVVADELDQMRSALGAPVHQTFERSRQLCGD